MNNEIEAGEYVRTRAGDICKVGDVVKFEDGDVHVYIEEKFIYLRLTEIAKHSKNILDLIEFDDFINGYKVNDVNKRMILCCDCKIIILAEDIKTILTHEQYEQNCYKMGV